MNEDIKSLRSTIKSLETDLAKYKLICSDFSQSYLITINNDKTIQKPTITKERTLKFIKLCKKPNGLSIRDIINKYKKINVITKYSSIRFQIHSLIGEKIIKRILKNKPNTYILKNKVRGLNNE